MSPLSLRGGTGITLTKYDGAGRERGANVPAVSGCVSEGSLLSSLHSITVHTRDTLGQDRTSKIGLMVLRLGHHRE